jgi:hypothetical protein
MTNEEPAALQQLQMGLVYCQAIGDTSGALDACREILELLGDNAAAPAAATLAARVRRTLEGLTPAAAR